ncbi:MAG: hypothetical protein AVDCRST_MAG06-1924, partial [uncultured Nocardioides sp.]
GQDEGRQGRGRQGRQAPQEEVLRVQEPLQPVPPAHVEGGHAAGGLYGQEAQAGQGRPGREEEVDRGL